MPLQVLQGERFLGNEKSLSRIKWDRPLCGVRKIHTLRHPLDDDMLLCDSTESEPRQFVSLGILRAVSFYNFDNYDMLSQTSPVAVLGPCMKFAELEATVEEVAGVCRRLENSVRNRDSVVTHSLLSADGYPVLRFPRLLQVSQVDVQLCSVAYLFRVSLS